MSNPDINKDTKITGWMNKKILLKKSWKVMEKSSHREDFLKNLIILVAAKDPGYHNNDKKGKNIMNSITRTGQLLHSIDMCMDAKMSIARLVQTFKDNIAEHGPTEAAFTAVSDYLKEEVKAKSKQIPQKTRKSKRHKPSEPESPFEVDADFDTALQAMSLEPDDTAHQPPPTTKEPTTQQPSTQADNGDAAEEEMSDTPGAPKARTCTEPDAQRTTSAGPTQSSLDGFLTQTPKSSSTPQTDEKPATVTSPPPDAVATTDEGAPTN